MSRSRIILGLDPGSRRTGYGILCDGDAGVGARRLCSGTIRLDETRPFAERLPELRQGILPLLRRYQPTCASLETCFVNKSARSALVLGHVRGVLLLLCLEEGLEVFEYSPAEIKRCVTGSGAASKAQVGAMLRRIVAGTPETRSEDEIDAMAAAFCHWSRPAWSRARPLLGPTT
jgi:crossover junction endodeoxyribonuclease RuvC